MSDHQHQHGHIVDSFLFGDRYATPSSRRIFCDVCRVQRWLTVEAELALAQADLGILPCAVAEAIAAAARVDAIDLDAVREETDRAGHSLVGLLRVFQGACAGDAGQYIHFGATTQDIQDTGQVLEMRDVLDELDALLRRIAGCLARFAGEHAETESLGRTHAQPALPMTFGLKVASWLDEIMRHLARLDELRPRVLVAQLFGGAGTMAAFGPRGPELLARFAERLGLGAPAMGWHVARDRVTDYVGTLAMVAGTMGRVADELRTLSRPEFGEVSEAWRPGKVGSSTMPHKRNPERLEQVVVLARLAAAQVPNALAAMIGDHERDSRALRLEWVCVPDVSHHTLAACDILLDVVSGLRIHHERLRTNMSEVAERIMSERLMLTLADRLGKQSAHELVYQLTQRSREENTPIRDLLRGDPDAMAVLDEQTLGEVFEPAAYLGASAELTRRVVAESSKVLDPGGIHVTEGGTMAAESEPDNYVGHALALFEKYGNEEAIVGAGRRLTYIELRAEILALAAAMHAHGVRADTTVAVVLGHPPEGPAVLLALHLLGARTVWVRTGVAERETAEQLRLTQPDLLLYDTRSGNPLGGQVGHRLGVPMLCLGPHGHGPDLLAHQGSSDFDPGIIGGEPETIFQTSGTTGVPKMVHHHQRFYWQIHRLAEEIIAAEQPRWRHLTLSVLGHVSGQISALLYLFTGATLVVMEGWDPVEFLALVARERVNSTFIPPPYLYDLLAHPGLERADCTSMLMLSVGAAPASPVRLREAIERFGPVLRITYGLSECPFISANNALSADPAQAKRLGSAGIAYGDVEVEIRSEDGVTAVDPGQVGELWVRSDLNFAGYYRQPELTTWTLVDGWVRTRDLGYRDDDGYLYLVGRTQDLIITGRHSWKVWPRPIEDALTGHPAVRAAAVIGVPDPETVEAVHAFVELAPHAAVTPEELAAQVRGELTELWVPRSFDFVDELPINGTGKVDKNTLRARYAAAHTTHEA